MSEAPQGLKIGDRVRLRSGGPLMVVMSGPGPDIDGGFPEVRCRWFDENGHVNAAWYVIATLQVIEGAAK